MPDRPEFERDFADRTVEMGLVTRADLTEILRRTAEKATAPIDRRLIEAGALTEDEATLVLRSMAGGGLVGNEIGGFLVEAFVKAGGMGELYRGVDRQLDRPVAIKVLRGRATRERVERLRREARLAARIDHPNTVGVLASGEEGGRFYYVMPFVEGSDLAQHAAARGGSLGVPEVYRIAIQAARGLEAVHRAGIVHRDVKPENLLIDESGRVHVVDLGIALDASSDARLTATGEILGTPHFVAPEMLSAVEPDGRADIYSLGLTLYFLLTGRTPFEGGALEVLDQQRRSPMPDPREFDPTIDPALVAYLRRMTAKEREQRPASMADVVRDLRDLATGRSRPARRLRWRVLLGSLAAIAVLVGGALLWPRGGPPAPPAPGPQPVDEPPARDRLAEAVARTLGPSARLVGQEGDLLTVEAVYEFDDPSELRSFVSDPKGYRLGVVDGVLRAERVAAQVGQSTLLLPVHFLGPLEIAIALRLSDEAAAFVGVVHHHTLESFYAAMLTPAGRPGSRQLAIDLVDIEGSKRLDRTAVQRGRGTIQISVAHDGQTLEATLRGVGLEPAGVRIAESSLAHGQVGILWGKAEWIEVEHLTVRGRIERAAVE